ETRHEFNQLRHNAGAIPAAGALYRGPDLGMISGSALPAAEPFRSGAFIASPRRPLVVRLGKRLRGLFDRIIGGSSLVSNDPVLDVRDFAWTALLRDNWQAIRAEAVAHALGNGSPSLASVSPDHRAIAPMHKWRSFFLWGYGYSADDNIARCP